VSNREVVKICPALILYSEHPVPVMTGRTWEDLTVHVRELRTHIELLNEDRVAINTYCASG
jgi:hypothetical protein